MAALLDNTDQMCDMAETLKLVPVQLTRLEDFIQTQVAMGHLREDTSRSAGYISL